MDVMIKQMTALEEGLTPSEKLTEMNEALEKCFIVIMNA